MFSRFIRSPGVVLALVILAAGGYWWVHARAPKSIATGYIADRDVTLWNTLAQVRQPVADLHYGERVEVVSQEGTAAQVRTTSGTLGWMLDSHQLMDVVLWQRSADLLARARNMPVQARGHTKAVSNLRADPGRNGMRIFQFVRGTPVVVLERAVADAPVESAERGSAGEKSADDDAQKPKQEDWLFVMRAGAATVISDNSGVADHPAAKINPASGDPVSGGPGAPQPSGTTADSAATPVAGWMLARFIELDLPGPVRDHASSSNMRVVAWFELNRVPDGSGGEAPQYLVAGSHGGGGQDCDFTMLRVYTWGAARMRYETAYVEGDLCGHLPIRVSRSSGGPAFHFAVAGAGAADRAYLMQQTSVRLIKKEPSVRSPRKH